MRPLKLLAPYLKRHPGRLAAALGALMLATLSTLALPMALRRIIDHGFARGDEALVNQYFAMLLVLATTLALASALRFYFVTWLGEKLVADLRRDVFAHVIRLSPAFYDRTLSGEIVSRLTADTTQIKAAVGSTVSQALRNLFLFLGAAAMMAVTSPHLSALVLLAIPFVVIPLVVFGRRVKQRSRLAQDRLADASAYATEAIGAVRTLQALTGEDAAAGRVSRSVMTAFEAARDAMQARAWLTGVAIFFVFASIVAVLWMGAWNVLTGTMTAGELGQFVLYSVLAAGALGELSQVWSEVSLAAGAAGRLGELLAEKSAITAPATPVRLPEPGRGEIAFRGVSFAYPGAPERTILDRVDFSVQPGRTVAIVGPSGAGKSTLFHLALRFYDPTAGQVELDGIALPAADPTDLRQRVAIVPQDVTIFAGSVRENIRIGRPGASDAEVEEAAAAANADGFIRALPAGYETEVGERGVTLSGGQRQRVAIARAILEDAPLLLLDEATSALDAESEIAVQAALERLTHGRTTLVIAHRLATVLKADRILVLDHGQIVEDGDHATLVKAGGLYARLARLQFEQGARALESDPEAGFDAVEAGEAGKAAE